LLRNRDIEMSMAPNEDSPPLPSVVVVIPCLNEENHIKNTLARFMAEPTHTVCKIVVSDGGSTDRTLQIVEECAQSDSRVAVLHNHQRIQSSGINRAVEEYGDLARFIVRVDAHADYPVGFCATLLAAQRSTGANSVVISMIAKGITCFQTAAAAAQNSRLGNGGSAHRIVAQGRFVDHGHHALMEVRAFRSVGGYDEAFSHNEDAELDFRLIAAGFRIYLCAGADITYYPRNSPHSLLRQYGSFGRGRAMNMRKHHAEPKLRQLIPVMVGPAVVASILSPLASFLAIPAMLWTALCIAYGIALGVRAKNVCACGAGTAAMLMHLGFSFGFISQILGTKVFGDSRPSRDIPQTAHGIESEMIALPDDASDTEIDVSVIVANYNGEKFIADAIRSACRQTLTSIEIVVCDDASTDSSVQIVKNLIVEDGRIRLIETSTNRGAAAARNRALNSARGRWISVLDSDDLMHPDRLRLLVAEGKKSDADIVADDLLLFDNDRRVPPQTLFAGKWAKAGRWISAEDYLATNNFYGRGPALGYLKPIFRAATIAKQNIRYDERLTVAEDYNFVFRLLMAGAKFRTTPEIGYFYRRHSGSISHRLKPSVLRSILDVEQGYAARWPLAALQPLFRSRERSIRRAIAFDELVQAIKSRQLAKAAMMAIADPAAAWLLRLPLKQYAARLRPGPKPAQSDRRQICILTRQRIASRTNGSSRYLLDIADFLAGRGFDVHLVIPSPVTMGRWPFLKLSEDLDVFKTIRFRGTVRLGRYIVAFDPRIAVKGALGLLDRVLYRSGLVSRRLSRPAPYAIAQTLTRQDRLFIAREAPSIADAQIADYCFLTEAYPYALRPDARRIVIMHDLFSSRSAQFAKLNASDSVATLPLEEELRMLARAETIVAIQRDEAAVLQRKLPRHEIVVAPMAAVPVSQAQIGRSETVLFVGSSAAPNADGLRWFIESCWPTIRERRPNAMLYIAGSVCNTVAGTPPATKLLNVVGDLDDLYTEASVVISPLLAGSGLKIKLIEGLSKGKAMVVTTTTLQGVADTLNGCTLVDDSASGFASLVVNLLGDPRKREELGARGISAISRHFSPEHAYGAIVSAAERGGAAAIQEVRAC
jgi:glycosyltransferase involved in cell wall biosynthesis